MSALGGVCYWDGRPVPLDRLSGLAAHLKVAGPHGGGCVQPSPWLALQSHVLHFDRLSAGERQPFVFGRGSVLTWDGRLDNRDDLLLSLHRHLRADRSDAALVAAAYERWGADAFPKLIGDWCVAIWDAAQERVVIALDYMGVRPLYYRAEPDGLAWSTRLEAIVACEQLFDAIDDVYIAGHLTKVGNPDEATPFVGVTRLLAGHVLISTRNSTTVRRYWTYSPNTIRYGGSQQYADQFRELLTDAVRVRLRSTRTVWAHLSGGWDSSSVVCLAHRLIEQGAVEAPAIQPVSLIWGDPEASEERRFMAAVEEWCGRDTVEVPFQGRPTFSDMVGHLTPMIRASSGFGLEDPFDASGDHVILTGTMGDLSTGKHGGGPLTMTEPFDEGHPLLALRGLVRYARHAQLPFTKVLFQAIQPRLDWLSSSRVTGHAGGSTRNGVPTTGAGYDGVEADLLSRVQARPLPETPSCAMFRPTIRPLIKSLYRWANSGKSSAPDFFNPVMLKTHPYLHRPFIEFLAAIPALALFDPIFSRAGMKRAMIDVLPPAILKRATKVGSVAASEIRQRNRKSERMQNAHPFTTCPEEWLVVQRGVARSAKLAEDLRRLRSVNDMSVFLSHCCCIEAWLLTLVKRTRESTTPLEFLSDANDQVLDTSGSDARIRSN
jgi:hypothetical protein